MTDTHAPDPPRARLQLVRARAPRKDGWSPQRREKFLGELAETCNVKLACAAVKMSDVGAYKLRRRDAGFRLAWRRALTEGYAKLEIQMLERALIGEVKMREAVIDVSPTRAIELLSRYSPRVAELLYRTHRAEALAAEADDSETEEADEAVLIDSIMAKLEVARESLIAEMAGADVTGQ